MAPDDVQDTGSQLVIDSSYKTDIKRVFTVINDVKGIDYLEIFRRYVGIRPNNLGEKKLFMG